MMNNTVFTDCINTKIKYYTIIKTLHSSIKTLGQICTTISTMSASHFLQNDTHSDLQNTKHTCIH